MQRCINLTSYVNVTVFVTSRSDFNVFVHFIDKIQVYSPKMLGITARRYLESLALVFAVSFNLKFFAKV